MTADPCAGPLDLSGELKAEVGSGREYRRSRCARRAGAWLAGPDQGTTVRVHQRRRAVHADRRPGQLGTRAGLARPNLARRPAGGGRCVLPAKARFPQARTRLNPGQPQPSFCVL